jgi:hypothetical protein
MLQTHNKYLILNSLIACGFLASNHNNNNNNNTLYFHWVTGFTQSNFRPGTTF